MFGDRAVMMIGDMDITIPIDSEASNVPMVFDSSCSTKEIKEIGPHIRSALPHYERKVDFLGSWSKDNFANWGLGNTLKGRHSALPNIARDENINLTNTRKNCYFGIGS